MINNGESCMVSPPMECNHATISSKSATESTTKLQQDDLIALSRRVLANNSRNKYSNNSATPMLQHVQSSFIKELRILIKAVSQSYGGDDDTFLENYIDDVIAVNHDNLTTAISCFRDIANQRSPFIKWK